MSAAAILVIVVATGEAVNPTTTALVATAAEALGSGTAIRLIATADPAAADAHRIERELGAGAVVALVWSEPAHTKALILLHVAATDAWTRRTMTFAAGDALGERGRMLGFAVGSMWPEGQTEVGEAGARASASPPANAAAKKPPPALAAGAASAPSVTSVAAAAAAPDRRFALVVAGVGALGSGGEGPAFGGGAAGSWIVAPAWAVRIGVGLRGSDVPELPGSDFIGTLAAGVEWWPAWGRFGAAWRTGVRADALAVGQWVRYSPPETTETQQRVLPGIDLAVQSAVALGQRTELRVVVGAELAGGRTDLRRGGTRTTVATIPAAQMLAEVGLAVGF